MVVIELMQGKKEQVSFSDAEGTFGTAATLVEALGRNARFDPNINNQNWTRVLGAGTEDLDVPVREQGQEMFGGILSFVPQNWKFLKFVLLKQSSDVTDTGSAPTVHTFTNTEAGLLSFTLERAIQASTDRVRTYEGCQVQSFSLAWDSSGPGNFLEASANILAEDANNSTSTTSLSPPTNDGFKPRFTTLTLEGSTVTYLKSGTFTITNTLTDGRYANQSLARLKDQSVPQLRTYNLTAVAHYTDDTFWDMFDSADVLGSTNTLVFQRAANDNLTITFTNAYLQNPPDPTNLEAPNNVMLNMEINSCAFVAKDALTDYQTFT